MPLPIGLTLKPINTFDTLIYVGREVTHNIVKNIFHQQLNQKIQWNRVWSSAEEISAWIQDYNNGVKTKINTYYVEIVDRVLFHSHLPGFNIYEIQLRTKIRYIFMSH